MSGVVVSGVVVFVKCYNYACMRNFYLAQRLILL